MVRAMVTAVAVAAWMAGSAFAQVSQLNTGQQLDANYQVGSGGYNTVVGGTGGVNTQLNSQLYINGQVSGLANFRGRVPYVASDQLNLVLPSSALDNFRQQSVGLQQATAGQNYLTQPYYTGMKTVLGTGGITEGRNLPGSNMPINTQAQPKIVQTYDELLKDYKPLMPQGSGVPMTSTLLPEGGRIAGESPLVSTFQSSGLTIGMPLFGMAGAEERKLSSELYELGLSEQGDLRLKTMLENQPRTGTGEPAPLSPLGGGTPQPGLPGKTPGLTSSGTSQETAPGAGGAPLNNPTINPVQNPAHAPFNRSQGTEDRPAPQMQTLGTAAPGQVTIPVDQNAAPGTPGQTIPVPTVPGGQTLGGYYKPAKTIETPPPMENDDAYYNLMLQMMKKRSAEKDQDAAAGATAGGQPAGGTTGSTLSPTAKKDSPGAETPPAAVLYSLAGNSHDMFNNYVTVAQNQLKAGKYYEAAANFESALIANPANPLARVGAAIAYFAAGEPFTAGYHLHAAMQIFPPLMETKMEVLKLVDESVLRDRLDRLDLRLEKRPETRSATLLLISTYMHANLGQKELAREYANMLFQHCGEDKLLEAYAHYVRTGVLPKAAKSAASAPSAK